MADSFPILLPMHFGLGLKLFNCEDTEFQIVLPVSVAQIPPQRGDFSGEILKTSRDAEGVWRRLVSAWKVLSAIKLYPKFREARKFWGENMVPHQCKE